MANILRVLPILIVTILVCSSHSAPTHVSAPPSYPRSNGNELTPGSGDPFPLQPSLLADPEVRTIPEPPSEGSGANGGSGFPPNSGEFQVSETDDWKIDQQGSSTVEGSALKMETMDVLPKSEGLDSLGVVKRAVGGRRKLLKQWKSDSIEENPLIESQDEGIGTTEVNGMLHSALEKRRVKGNGRVKKRRKGKKRGKKRKGKNMSLNRFDGDVDTDGKEDEMELQDIVTGSDEEGTTDFVGVRRKFGKTKKGKKGKKKRKEARKSRKKLKGKSKAEEPEIDEFDYDKENKLNEVEAISSILRELYLDEEDSQPNMIAGGKLGKKRRRGRKGRKQRKGKKAKKNRKTLLFDRNKRSSDDDFTEEQDFLRVLQPETDELPVLFDQNKIDYNDDLTSPDKPKPRLGGTDMVGMLLDTVSESKELERNKRGARRKASRSRSHSKGKRTKVGKKTKVGNKKAKSKDTKELELVEALLDDMEEKKGRKTNQGRNSKSFSEGKNKKDNKENSKIAIAKVKTPMYVERPIATKVKGKSSRKGRPGKGGKRGRGRKKNKQEIEENFLKEDLEPESLMSEDEPESPPIVAKVKGKSSRKGRPGKGGKHGKGGKRGRGRKKNKQEIEENFLKEPESLMSEDEPESPPIVAKVKGKSSRKGRPGKGGKRGRGRKKNKQEIEENFLKEDLEPESSMSKDEPESFIPVPEYNDVQEPESSIPVPEYNSEDEPEPPTPIPEYDIEDEPESSIPVPEYNSEDEPEPPTPIPEYDIEDEPESSIPVPEYNSEDEPEPPTPIPEYDIEDEPQSPMPVPEYDLTDEPESTMPVPEYNSEDESESVPEDMSEVEPEYSMPVPERSPKHEHSHKHEPESVPEHSLKPQPPQESESDPCMRCEQKVGEEVCGANGKTYNSLCHAVNCAGLMEKDITAGPCMEKDPCANHDCPANELCIPINYGPCLALYTKDGHRLPCKLYMCVMEKKCNDNDNAEVCGEDSHTYRSLCHLHLAHQKLAYTGPCRSQCRGTVCGSNGRSFHSPCHAHAHNVRIDYYGPCFAEDLQEDIRDCQEVREAGRCPKLSCKTMVMPKGSCCPVCGGAVTVRPDVEALSGLVQHWEHTNHLYIAENYLRKLVPVNAEKECALSVTLTDKGEIEVVLAALNPKHAELCIAASKEMAEVVNNPPKAMAKDVMKPVAAEAKPEVAVVAEMINPFNPLGGIQNSVTKVNEKASKVAADKYNDALLSASKKADAIEQSRSGAMLPTAYCLVTLATVIASALLIVV